MEDVSLSSWGDCGTVFMSFYTVCRLWKAVSDAVVCGDMHRATQEKFVLEERQRQEAKERKAQLLDWRPKLFERDTINGDWMYKYIE